LCDALLGAAGLGDIGQHFPDTNPEYENIDSRILLRKVAQQIRDEGFRISNVDLTIIAEQPKLAPFLEEMRAKVAADLRIGKARVNLKATTTEGMGFTGRGEGIAVHALALLEE
jgi:2-C-methyl-D-erythritol 2,4-cyclodiphosphate synthase